MLGADAGRLANHVIVAGGQCSSSSSHVLDSAEVWNPHSDSWERLPPMKHARAGARGFVLPGGRFAVVGGMGLATRAGASTSSLEMRRDTEVYDVTTNAWTTLSDDCANCRSESRAQRSSHTDPGRSVSSSSIVALISEISDWCCWIIYCCWTLQCLMPVGCPAVQSSSSAVRLI